MDPKKRYLQAQIEEDLKEKMILLGGPRQVGKTTLSKNLSKRRFPSITYYNWDFDSDRKAMLKSNWPDKSSLIILDEIHKYGRWKNWIKGNYDKYNDRHQFLVTGSAKLNVYRRKGDSLLGRYHYYCLHPLTYWECQGGGASPKISEEDVFKELKWKKKVNQSTLDDLMKFGGFPEPFLKKSTRFLRRWHRERVDLLVKEDIRDLEDVKDISLLMLLAQLLPERAGSALSINAIREDLEVSHKAVSRWITLLEMVYYAYRIYPYHRLLSRSLKKESKLYLWDYSEIESRGPRFENLIANHLLKFANYLRDTLGFKAELNYLRTTDKREVDFLLSINAKPWMAIEVKLSNTTPSASLHYFKKKLGIPFVYQVVETSKVDEIKEGVHVISAAKFLSGLI